LLVGCGTAVPSQQHQPVVQQPAPTATLQPFGVVVFTRPSYSCKGAIPFGFTAYLNGHAGALKVTLVFASKNGSGDEKFVDRLDVDMTSPDNTQFNDGPIPIKGFCGAPFGPGTYVLRVVQVSGSAVLAEGTFVLTK
jgi:hypothetical protein